MSYYPLFSANKAFCYFYYDNQCFSDYVIKPLVFKMMDNTEF